MKIAAARIYKQWIVDEIIRAASGSGVAQQLYKVA